MQSGVCLLHRLRAAAERVDLIGRRSRGRGESRGARTAGVPGHAPASVGQRWPASPPPAAREISYADPDGWYPGRQALFARHSGAVVDHLRGHDRGVRDDRLPRFDGAEVGEEESRTLPRPSPDVRPDLARSPTRRDPPVTSGLNRAVKFTVRRRPREKITPINWEDALERPPNRAGNIG